jgi:hypothetical protein
MYNTLILYVRNKITRLSVYAYNIRRTPLALAPYVLQFHVPMIIGAPYPSPQGPALFVGHHVRYQ